MQKANVFVHLNLYSPTGVQDKRPSFKYLIIIGYFIIFITMVLALDLISSSEHIKSRNPSVMRKTVINTGKDMVKAGRLMHPLVLCSCDFFFLILFSFFFYTKGGIASIVQVIGFGGFHFFTLHA